MWRQPSPETLELRRAIRHQIEQLLQRCNKMALAVPAASFPDNRQRPETQAGINSNSSHAYILNASCFAAPS